MEWPRREEVKKMKPKPAVVNHGTPVRLPAFIVLSHDDIAVRAYAHHRQRWRPSERSDSAVSIVVIRAFDRLMQCPI
jgi:hypothetical protein